MTRNSNSLSVAVVGAGVAGLACARVLLTAGHQVTVFEKSRGVGGRMSARRGNGWQADHGAQYFTARRPEFAREVARWTAAGAAAPWLARIVSIGPMGKPEPVSPLVRYVGSPSMTAPARALSSGIDTITSMTINVVVREADGWYLSSVEHGVRATPFDAVAIAVAAPQAVPLLQHAAPGLARVAQRAEMRSSWAVMAQSGDAPDLGFDAAFVNHGPLRWIADDTSKPGHTGARTWVLHATSDWSQAHLDAAPEHVTALLVTAFQGLARGAAVHAATAHRWRYAEPVSSMSGVPTGHVWRASDRIGLCGDWLAGGKVEGAWLSGNGLGLAIARSLAMP
ncbi:Renalase [Burkholderia multivorans]